MNETLGKILLFVACMYMAGLNLWLLFKDWFNERYQRKKENKGINPKNLKNETFSNNDVSNIIGKSKTKLQDKSKESSSIRVEESEKEKEEKENKPIYSQPLEREQQQEIDEKQETIFLGDSNSKTTSYDQGVAVDEFSLLTDTLNGKAMSNNEKPQIKETLKKIQGTSFFEQFAAQVKGAEGIASAILSSSEEEEDTLTPDNNQFEWNKYIRK